MDCRDHKSILKNPADEIDVQGILIRIHDWGSKNRKASNRSWHEFLVVLSFEKNRLLVYKDEKHYNERPNDTYHKDSGLDVNDLTAAPASDYLKRPFVFRIKVASSGAQYLFQAKDQDDMLRWVNNINDRSQKNTSEPTKTGKSSTLPTSSSDPQTSSSQSVGFKKKFFTLTRKK